MRSLSDKKELSAVMKVSEPAVAYNTPYLQGLKNRLIKAIDESRDEVTSHTGFNRR
jgi:hypothetical protein